MQYEDNLVLFEIAQLALLNLYLTPQSLVTRENRELCLVRFLKPKLKDKTLRCIKHDLRVLLALGRHREKSLEKSLLELNALRQEYDY